MSRLNMPKALAGILRVFSAEMERKNHSNDLLWFNLFAKEAVR